MYSKSESTLDLQSAQGKVQSNILKQKLFNHCLKIHKHLLYLYLNKILVLIQEKKLYLKKDM